MHKLKFSGRRTRGLVAFDMHDPVVLKGVPMGFNGLVLSGLNHQARFAGGSATSFDSRSEERLAERTRIARELHDTLLQGFFSVSLQLQAAVNYLPPDSLVKPRCSNLVQLMNRVLEEGRRTVQGLRAPNDEQFSSLAQALAAVPNDLGLPCSIRFRVLVEGRQTELQEPARDEAYHIGREAIFNAFRHSGAKDIETQIEYRPGGLRLTVCDNGCGIDPQHLQWGRSGHWGLQGMRERAERIGARFRISSRVALGTEVELWVPEQSAFAKK
jgi:signal transduction histidine kinase